MLPLLGIGLALECLGVVGIVMTRRRRATRPLTTADLALGGHPAYAPSQVAQQPMWPHGTTPPPGPPPAPPRHPQQPFGPGR